MERYRTAVIQIKKQIKEDAITLNCQLRYYEYVRDNVAKMTGEIDRKIEQLMKEREKIVRDFTIAPQKIKEIKSYIFELGAKRNKMLITPKIARVKELRAKLKTIGVIV